ncbi:MAG: hypothetical protein HYX42_03260 [Polaromonas sp.]|uniref:hypothetical protein n=1 Tax=Polaromonas sp. TaxID=1869339 RepID=UPI0025EF04B0|nr:hypothetical protein [Polaromonas sp.]MBI2725249.1 hypothetical protein [Polaromonas sp.]
MRQSKVRKSVAHSAASVVLVTSLLAGCAGGSGLFGSTEVTPPFRDPGMSMQAAKNLIVIGQTTRADVTAALGNATIVKFDSGYEVWVYRAGSREQSAGKTEFVILFAPSGVVKKTRIRPAYATRAT